MVYTEQDGAVPSETYDQAIRRLETYGEAVQVGIELLGEESESNWNLGDLAARVIQLNDEQDGAFCPSADMRTAEPALERREISLRQFSKDVRVGYGRLKEAVRVARAVEPRVRDSFKALYWSHWRAMVRADLEGPALVEWAKRSEDDAWSGERLVEELREARTNGGGGSPPPPSEPWQTLDKSLTSVAVQLRRAASDEKVLARLVKEAPETAREVVMAAEAVIATTEKLWGELRATGERLRFAAGPARRPLQPAVLSDETTTEAETVAS